MKLGTRIFLSFILIMGLGFTYPFNWVLKNMRIRYLEGVEEPLVDQANILAEWVGAEIETHRFDPSRLHRIFTSVYDRDLSARIYNLLKKNVDIRVYIVRRSGRLVFDSAHKGNEGKDYSHWRDVSLTLAGKYGARASRTNSQNPATTVLHIAAPIMVKGEIWGSLTVAKPTTNINFFLKSAKPQVFRVAAFSVLAIILLSILFSLWLTRPIKLLTQYARDVRDGKRVILPRLGRSEISDMGHAFEEMREALEGKKYVEKYVQTLTHEIKSPLSAIKGAAELLEEDMPMDQRRRFLSNIRHESARIQDFVDRMLELSTLEARKKLGEVKTILLKALVASVLERINPVISQKGLKILDQVEDQAVVVGDPFLLKQAVSNLLNNAVDFSSRGDAIIIRSEIDQRQLTLMIEDNGPGIPDFAREKIFDKFFSLRRPDSGKKSTGLGLTFVREVAGLHQGSVVLENLPESGVRASLSLPHPMP